MDIEQLLKDFHSAYGSRLFTPAAVAVAATKRLDALDGPALDQLLKDIRTHSRDLAQLDYDELRLFQMLEKRAPLLALRAAPALLQRNDDMHQQYQSVVSSCLVALAKEDPDTASKEYRSLCDSGVLEGKGVDSLSYVLHGKFTAALLGTRFEEGKALFATLSEGGKSNALSTAALSTSAETRAFVLGEAADLKPNQRSRIMTGILCGETAQNGLEGATALFKQLPIDPGQSVLIAADFMRKLHSMEKMPVDEGLDWLRAQLPPVQFAEAGGLLLGKVRGFPSNQLQEARNNAFRATDWGPHRDEALAAFFSPESLPDDAGEALSLVVEIRDPALRMDTLRHITSRFKGQPREWEKAVESATTLTAEEKRRIFQP